MGVVSSERRYVVALDASRNEVVVGGEGDLWSEGLTASKVSFVSGEHPIRPTRVKVKIRHRAPEVWATLESDGGTAACEIRRAAEGGNSGAGGGVL